MPSPAPFNLKSEGLSLTRNGGRLLHTLQSAQACYYITKPEQLREVNRQDSRAVDVDILGDRFDILVGWFIGFYFVFQTGSHVALASLKLSM